jgi:hypothetical protein
VEEKGEEEGTMRKVEKASGRDTFVKSKMGGIDKCDGEGAGRIAQP